MEGHRTDYSREVGVGWRLLPFMGALKKNPQAWHLHSSCRKVSGSEAATISATSLMSANIMLPGFATADSFLGAHSSEVAGQGWVWRMRMLSSGPAVDEHAAMPMSGLQQDSGPGWGFGLASFGCKN